MLTTLLGLLLATAHADPPPVRGMTVATPTWGWEWGTPAMDGTLDQLQALGVNWVCIHPYARIHGDGRVTHRLDPADPPAWLRRPIEQAHARGMKVFVKPHLAYWGSPFSWRGEIGWDDPEATARFFADYGAWMQALATITHDADAFAVGTELDRTVKHEAAWRGIIADVRARTDAPLTYAANWDRHETVPFWDAVDVVGIQAYFPVAQGLADDTVPDRAVVVDGWRRIRATARAVKATTGKHVLFTELGYDRSTTALTQPWHAGRPGQHGDTLQQLALDVALDELAAEEAIVGAFLWNWMVGEVPTGHFRLPEPAMRAVIQQAWGTSP